MVVLSGRQCYSILFFLNVIREGGLKMYMYTCLFFDVYVGA